jgi:hypothetical protein
MKSDEGFLNNVDKQMLNELVNENVIPKSFLKNLETPEKSTSLAFFFVLTCDELCDEQVMNE